MCKKDIDLERKNRASVWYFCLRFSLISTDRECVYACMLCLCTSVCVVVSLSGSQNGSKAAQIPGRMVYGE